MSDSSVLDKTRFCFTITARRVDEILDVIEKIGDVIPDQQCELSIRSNSPEAVMAAFKGARYRAITGSASAKLESPNFTDTNPYDPSDISSMKPTQKEKLFTEILECQRAIRMKKPGLDAQDLTDQYLMETGKKSYQELSAEEMVQILNKLKGVFKNAG